MSWPELARNYYQARIIIIKVGWPAYLLDITHLLRTSEAVFTLKKEHIRIHALCLHIYILRHWALAIKSVQNIGIMNKYSYSCPIYMLDRGVYLATVLAILGVLGGLGGW